MEEIKIQLLDLIQNEFNNFLELNYNYNIVPNSIPIVWFGNVEKYLKSKLKVITVSLNPSDIEFKDKKSSEPSTEFRFPAYNENNVASLYCAYNNYFMVNPYRAWFNSSFGVVLKSFNVSFYDNADNTALHTDIGSPYATDPTWSRIGQNERNVLEPLGVNSWHRLVEILEPDVILFSASRNFETKITFPHIGEWKSINVNAKVPLLKRKLQISNKKTTVVLFQIQGRKPFFRTSREEKLRFIDYI